MEAGDYDMKRQNKVYASSEGRRMYAVCTANRKKAAELFTAATRHYFSASRLASHGFIWLRGQVASTDIIFENPEVVFVEVMEGCKRLSWDRVVVKEDVK